MKSNSLNRFLPAILFTMSLPMAFAADGTQGLVKGGAGILNLSTAIVV